MAKVTINGNALVITSVKKLEDIKAVSKYAPEALTLYGVDDNGKKCEDFKVGLGTGCGDINRFGVTFSDTTTNAQGLATVTIGICVVDGGDVKEYVADKFGASLRKLAQVEEQIAPALAVAKADKDAIMNDITVM